MLHELHNSILTFALSTMSTMITVISTLLFISRPMHADMCYLPNGTVSLSRLGIQWCTSELRPPTTGTGQVTQLVRHDCFFSN